MEKPIFSAHPWTALSCLSWLSPSGCPFAGELVRRYAAAGDLPAMVGGFGTVVRLGWCGYEGWHCVRLHARNFLALKWIAIPSDRGDKYIPDTCQSSRTWKTRFGIDPCVWKLSIEVAAKGCPENCWKQGNIFNMELLPVRGAGNSCAILTPNLSKPDVHSLLALECAQKLGCRSTSRDLVDVMSTPEVTKNCLSLLLSEGCGSERSLFVKNLHQQSKHAGSFAYVVRLGQLQNGTASYIQSLLSRGREHEMVQIGSFAFTLFSVCYSNWSQEMQSLFMRLVSSQAPPRLTYWNTQLPKIMMPLRLRNSQSATGIQNPPELRNSLRNSRNLSSGATPNTFFAYGASLSTSQSTRLLRSRPLLP